MTLIAHLSFAQSAYPLVREKSFAPVARTGSDQTFGGTGRRSTKHKVLSLLLRVTLRQTSDEHFQHSDLIMQRSDLLSPLTDQRKIFVDAKLSLHQRLGRRHETFLALKEKVLTMFAQGGVDKSLGHHLHNHLAIPQALTAWVHAEGITRRV